jgi:hypothetical protein
VSRLNATDPIVFRERVRPNLGTFASIFVLLPAVTLVSEPFDFRIGLALGSFMVIGIWLALYFLAPVIEVGPENIKAGSAVIARKLLGHTLEIQKDEIFHERGPGLDPASYKMFQGTVRTAVKIAVEDPNDPTPYWILSTRRPAELAGILNGSS